MSGFSSLDNFVNNMSAIGNFWRTDWNKNTFGTTAHTAGLWYLLSQTGGNPAASSHLGSGVNLLYQPCYNIAAACAGLLHGGNVGAAGDGYKCIINASAFSAAATSMPAVFMLVDLLGWHTITSVTTTGAQTLINSNTASFSSSSGLLGTYTNDFLTYTKVRFTTTGTLPTGLSLATDYWTVRVSATTARFATSFANAIAGTVIPYTDGGSGTHTMTVRHARYGDGAGVQSIIVPSTVMGAATPNITLTYTNSQGTASKTTPSSPALPIGTTAAPVSNIVYSGTGSGKYGPFMPLANADAGIQSVQSLNLSASYLSGVLNLAYVKPILSLPMTTIGVACERDLLNQIPSLPRVYDGACLAWLMYAGAATPVNSAFYGHLDFAWS